MDGVLPSFITRTNCSFVCRSLSKVWPEVLNNVIWTIDDGQPVDTLRVCDVVDNAGDWDWVRLRRWLPHWILTYIATMIISSSLSVLDQFIWKWKASDKFSSKETFKNLYQVDSTDSSIQWNLVWKAKTPQRVRVFLWLLWQNRILTNGEILRIHITTNSHCLRCGCGVETSLRANQNLFVFSDGHSCVQELVDKGTSWMWSVLSSRLEPPFSHPRAIASHWSRLEEGYIKLNIDGAVEGREMLEGFCLASDKRFRKLELECDNGLLVETIIAGGAVDRRITTLRLLHSMLIRPWEVCVRHIPRAQNTVAEQLIKFVSPKLMRFNLMEDPRLSIRELLMVESNLFGLN
ncbi:uncharacterized protein LOC105795995 [Gossypium raimondii]|uniref:uncharacterized protein LOC105795995 n=1 Tax=Gossypium raimondii TaxID=29730 RepID=UPI00063AB40F|nr:uncharacterized protein LOC105795995 [Gossypium raimondii]